MACSAPAPPAEVNAEASGQTLGGEDAAGSPSALHLRAAALKAHGGAAYDTAFFQFTFRDKRFLVANRKGQYEYQRLYEKDGAKVSETVTEDGEGRMVDGKPVRLSEKQRSALRESINSVVYFATLPHKLMDAAVNLIDLPDATIRGQAYGVLGVNFDKQGGGKDHDDNFVYWINRETNRIDYLAYDYRTNGGGVRFRAAYNPRVVRDILFQDYVNYSAPIGTVLTELAGLYERGELKELSRIETEAVVALPYDEDVY